MNISTKNIVAAVVVILVIVLSIAFYAKSKDERMTLESEQSAAINAAQLEGKSFRFISYNSVPVPVEQKYILNFIEDRISIKFCNGMGGNYTVEDAVLKAQLISTLMYCAQPENLMTLENIFGRLLNEGATVTLVNGTLTITNSVDTLTFAQVFEQ